MKKPTTQDTIINESKKPIMDNDGWLRVTKIKSKNKTKTPIIDSKIYENDFLYCISNNKWYEIRLFKKYWWYNISESEIEY